ncbi:hypothetical protein [Rhodococcus erythropolis]|uniref:hypothetical protein n=1 Tax=Rhodococcus erythropolis TaxID=1833 RepID=UPI001BECD874|nr:hypothetical protein [Rhodococcus erythropolis]MBT2269613.1 hypothetical protein [Rhodococcus erythropolis]
MADNETDSAEVEPTTWGHLESALRDVPTPGNCTSFSRRDHAALAERVSILALQPDPFDARGFAYPEGVRGTLQRAAQIHATLAALPPEVLPTKPSEAQS